MRFQDRREAGKMLASPLREFRDSENTLVVGLPRGGVPVAFEIATALGLPLDVLAVRKLGFPSQPELAMGAIGPAGVRVFNEYILPISSASSLVSREELARVVEMEEKELARREALYRNHKPPLDFSHQRIILVDDGLATGTTMRAAIASARKLGASSIIVAVPVSADETACRLEAEGIRVICLLRPLGLEAIGLWYANFDQLRDSEVLAFLDRAAKARKAG